LCRSVADRHKAVGLVRYQVPLKRWDFFLCVP
jgi:hypothetical protein